GVRLHAGAGADEIDNHGLLAADGGAGQRAGGVPGRLREAGARQLLLDVRRPVGDGRAAVRPARQLLRPEGLHAGVSMGQEHHPKGLYVLFFTEMWERFSFYLMLGILPLYLSDSQKGGMGWSDAEAAVVVGSYIALVYFTPFIGGLIADRLLGCRRTIL